MKEIIFIRHGETDSNVRGAYLGWTDVELNDKGLFQAVCARQKLEGIAVKNIYSSPLKRAAVTAEIINVAYNVPVIYSDMLKERNFGIWDDLSHSEIVERYPLEYEQWMKNMNSYVVSGGESALMAYERIKAFANDLINSKDEGTYIIVTHLGCIRKFLGHMLGMGIEGSWRFRIDNCGVTKIIINDEGYCYLEKLNA